MSPDGLPGAFDEEDGAEFVDVKPSFPLCELTGLLHEIDPVVPAIPWTRMSPLWQTNQCICCEMVLLWFIKGSA